MRLNVSSSVSFAFAQAGLVMLAATQLPAPVARASTA